MHNRIAGFDGIRALAVLSVILTHLHIYEILIQKEWLSREIVRSINGTTGVQAFFILSGFLITYLLIREHRRYGAVSLRNFYIRRTLRIFPLYFFILFMIVILHIFGNKVTNWHSIFFASIYSYNFIPKEWYTTVLGHTWSLAVEEHFYLIWPLLFVTLGFKSIKTLQVLILLAVLSLLIHLSLNQSEYLKEHFFVYRWTFIAGINIAYGCFFAILLSDPGLHRKAENLFSSSFSLFFGVAMWLETLWLPHSMSFYGDYIKGLGLALIIVWIYLNQKSLLTSFLEWRPLRYLGTISYGVYMYQGFFLATGPYRDPGQTWPPSQHIGLLLLIIVAPLSWHFFEKPLLRLKSKFER